MQEISVIIPNYNGMAYLDGVLSGLECQTVKNFEVILVDNGSGDGSCAFVAASYPWVRLIELPENFGFCKAVNEGIKASRAPYVLLLNNDIEVTRDFIEQMLQGIRRHPKAFSGAARMIQFHDRDRLDDAGNYYCALGWAFARGKGKNIHTYEKEEKIFASCAGAAIYRKAIFEKIGYFDEEHFAYLEDMDVGYRARINGYENWYFPLAKVYHVGSGEVTVGGEDVRNMTCDSLLRNISMVFQKVYLFHDTIENNIRFGNPSATQEEIIEAAKKARCHDFIMALPDGYETVIGEGGSTLSGGEKQRISIARAILKNANIVILDEATASIDPENEHLIQQAISELTIGKTVIVIAHRLATIEHADQILVVDKGQVVQKGTHQELVHQEGLYRRFITIREQAEGWSIV